MTCEPTLVVADILAIDCVINYVFPVASYSINIIADVSSNEKHLFYIDLIVLIFFLLLPISQETKTFSN